jgi:hypothetical protein
MSELLKAADQLFPTSTRPHVDTAIAPLMANIENHPEPQAPAEILSEWQKVYEHVQHYLKKINLPGITASRIMHLALREINKNSGKTVGHKSPAVAVLEVLRKEVTNLSATKLRLS